MNRIDYYYGKWQNLKNNFEKFSIKTALNQMSQY